MVMDDIIQKLEDQIKNNKEVKAQLLEELEEIKTLKKDDEKIDKIIASLEDLINNVFIMSELVSNINALASQASKTTNLLFESQTNTITPSILNLQERLNIVESQLGLYGEEELVEESSDTSDYQKAWDEYLDTLDFSDTSLDFQKEMESFNKRWEEEHK